MLLDAARKSIVPYGQDLRLKLARQKGSVSFQSGVNAVLVTDTVVMASVAVDEPVTSVVTAELQP